LFEENDMTEAIAMPVVNDAAPLGPVARLGYGASLTDVAAFEGALMRARDAQAHGFQAAPVNIDATDPARAPGQAMEVLFQPLTHIDGAANALATQAQTAMASGASLTPGEMVNLTVKCHEFMFQCQLTANAANRTSDGLQQLFKQQS
jgi:hypothetical protein